MRIITWNCHDLNSQPKRTQLLAYVAAKNIDYAFVQEGYNGNVGTQCVTTSEKHTQSNDFTFDSTTNEGKILLAAFRPSAKISGVGGMGTNKNYNILHPPTTAAPTVTEPDYMANAAIQDHLNKPAKAAYKMPLPAYQINVKLYALATSPPPPYKFKQFGIASQSMGVDIKGPTQDRVSLCSHRRPKSVSVTYNGNPLMIYFWHAPIGGDTNLASQGFAAQYTFNPNQYSGGQLAPAANLLFSRYLGLVFGSTDMPADTLLVGDLNVKQTVAKTIYGSNSNVESSLDDLCHVISPSGIVQTRQLQGDFAYQHGQYECTVATYNLLSSDHAPVIVDI